MSAQHVKGAHHNACQGLRRDRGTGTLSYVGSCLSSLTCAMANCMSKCVYWARGISSDKELEKLKNYIRKVQKWKAEVHLVKAKFSEHFQIPFVSEMGDLMFPYRLIARDEPIRSSR